MKRTTRRGAAFAVAAALALSGVTACGSGSGGTDSGPCIPESGKCGPSVSVTDLGPAPSNAPQATPCETGWSWDTPCSVPKAQGTSKPIPSNQPVARWGTWEFGSCGTSLYPVNIGLQLIPGMVDTISMRIGTACVGYQPQEFTMHIHLYRWSSKGGGAPPVWHEVVVNGFPIVLSYVKGASDAQKNNLLPLGTLDPETGEVPWDQQHHITAEVGCVPADQPGQPSLYYLKTDILGISYGGDPIIGGGAASPLIVPASQCNPEGRH